ncbi:MAG: AraC family transcriptional regulator [Marinifilaceae bacterium]|jgi:AraC-like DNA-binding protein|nr:AraC family transcriptional regulator [Marinifilaceae bacterium]
MRCKYYEKGMKCGEFDHELVFNSNGISSQNSTFFEKQEIGRVLLKTNSFNGINIIESKSKFYNPTIAYDSVGIKQDSFIMFFNLGQIIHADYGNRFTLEKNSHNIWSLEEGKSSSFYFNQNQENHSLLVSLEDNYLERLIEQYPEVLKVIYESHLKHDFTRWSNCDLPISSEIFQVLNQINNAYLMGDYYSMYIESKINELIILQLHEIENMNQKVVEVCKSSTDVDKIYEAKSIILDNYENPPSIYDLSKMVGLNRDKLKKGFKEIFNQTIFECLFEFKMHKAYRLIFDTKKSISEIGFDCGYSYASHFTTAFRRKFGFSPNELRKSNSRRCSCS